MEREERGDLGSEYFSILEILTQELRSLRGKDEGGFGKNITLYFTQYFRNTNSGV